MFPKNNKIFDSNHIGLLLIIFLFYVTEDFDLGEGLFWKFGIIFDHLQCHLFFMFVVEYTEDLAVWTFAYEGQDLVAIANMIILDKIIFLP